MGVIPRSGARQSRAGRLGTRGIAKAVTITSESPGGASNYGTEPGHMVKSVTTYSESCSEQQPL